MAEAELAWSNGLAQKEVVNGRVWDRAGVGRVDSPGAHAVRAHARAGETSPSIARSDRTWQNPGVFQRGGRGGHIGRVE